MHVLNIVLAVAFRSKVSLITATISSSMQKEAHATKPPKLKMLFLLGFASRTLVLAERNLRLLPRG